MALSCVHKMSILCQGIGNRVSHMQATKRGKSSGTIMIWKGHVVLCIYHKTPFWTSKIIPGCKTQVNVLFQVQLWAKPSASFLHCHMNLPTSLTIFGGHFGCSCHLRPDGWQPRIGIICHCAKIREPGRFVFLFLPIICLPPVGDNLVLFVVLKIPSLTPTTPCSCLCAFQCSYFFSVYIMFYLMSLNIIFICISNAF